MGKKKICLITNWYPTKENPYAGLFLKEQVFATANDFDYLVIHCREIKRVFLGQVLLKKLTNKSIQVEKVNEEKNTFEYNVDIFCPLYLTFFDKIYDLYYKFTNKERLAGVGVYRSPMYVRWKNRYLREVFQNRIKEKFDVLYCVDAQSESSTLKYVSEIRNVPYIVSEHAPIPWPGTTIMDIESDAIANADLFMAISHDKIRQTMLQNIKLKKIAYVGNMVDESQFVLAASNNEVKTFIIVAAHSFYKNYDLFFDIFNRLVLITDMPFKVMIVGYGANKGYSQNSESVEYRAKNSNFSHCVELIPEISHDQIHKLYGRADAFVMTSIQEGQPVSALEAACCGLPIFSTICGGVEDYVKPEIGRLYKMQDPESFANGLKDFLEGKLGFDSERIREHVVNLYGRDAFTTRFTNTVQEILENNKRGEL